LNGGITELPEGRSTDPSKFIKVATE